MSAVPYCFSGCSFAQPLGLAPFGKKPHCALNQGTLPLTFIFSPTFHARSITLHFARATFRSHPAVAVQLPQHRHVAPHKKNSVKTPFFLLRCLGVFFEPEHLFFKTTFFRSHFIGNFSLARKTKNK